MHNVSRRALITATALAFAGCSGNAPTNGAFAPPLALQRRNASPTFALPNVASGWPKKKNQPILFAADGPSGVLMFDPNKADGSPEGSIVEGISGAAGLAVDSKCTLYVANISADTVTVYPRGYISPKYIISDGLSWPYGVGIDSKGDVFVSNIYSDTLTAYHKGQTSPYETISFDTYGAVMGVAVDAKDNIWVVSDYGPPYLVFEVPSGTTQVNDAKLQDLDVPIGIAFGQNDEMYVSNLESSVVNVYKYGSTKPSRTIVSGVEHYGATLNAVTAAGLYFQANQVENVVGYKSGASQPFSTLNVTEPLGLASCPLVKK
ncbi:MAG TPA: hypothetical protein VKR56_10480 [Candidatus Cybelea sp.]|nr:hypothetical protein [Candidatus Cybelea sp.]